MAYQTINPATGETVKTFTDISDAAPRVRMDMPNWAFPSCRRGQRHRRRALSLIADASPRGARLDPARPRQQRLSMTDHDLAGDFAACVMAPSGLGVGKGKHAVNDRSDPVLFHHSA
jgi:hypothetical protein